MSRTALVVLMFCILAFLKAADSEPIPCDCSREFVGDRLDLVRAAGNQKNPSGDVDPVTGRYFMSWNSFEPPPPGQQGRIAKIQGRLYTPSGSPLTEVLTFDSGTENVASFYNFAVNFNTNQRVFFVTWSYFFMLGTSARGELRAQKVSTDGGVAGPVLKLRDLSGSAQFNFFDSVFNRNNNQYAILYLKTEIGLQQSFLLVQNFNASGHAVGGTRLIESTPANLENATMRLDPARNRYAIAWNEWTDDYTQRTLYVQFINASLTNIAMRKQVSSHTSNTLHLVFDGTRRSIVLFYADHFGKLQSSFVNPQGISPAINVPIDLRAGFAGARSNPLDGGFVIFYHRTPRVARLDANFNVLENPIFPSCQSGDRNYPSLLMYNAAMKEYLVIWIYFYYGVDGGMEIHGRRLRAIPSATSGCKD